MSCFTEQLLLGGKKYHWPHQFRTSAFKIGFSHLLMNLNGQMGSLLAEIGEIPYVCQTCLTPAKGALHIFSVILSSLEILPFFWKVFKTWENMGNFHFEVPKIIFWILFSTISQLSGHHHSRFCQLLMLVTHHRLGRLGSLFGEKNGHKSHQVTP